MRRRGSLFSSGFLAAIFAATLQFVVWGAALAGGFAPETGGPAVHQCETVPGKAPGAPAMPHGAACALCPVCLGLTLAQAPPLPAQLPAPIRIAAPARYAPLYATPPPARRVAAASPRGPPAV